MKAVNPKDIRLGNWLKHSPNADWAEDVHNKPVQVDIHTLLEIDGTYRYKDIQELYLPIEISPEILEKAGFVKIEGKDSIYDKGQMRAYLGINGSLCYTEYEKGSYCYLRLIQYTHELQNLHYALYNSELPLNL